MRKENKKKLSLQSLILIAIYTYVGCTKAITNNQDIRPLVNIKALFTNIS